MRYTIYEDPRAHTFAFLALPFRFADGDPLPITGVDRWFPTRADAVAALSSLLNRDEPDGRPQADAADDIQAS